MWRKGAGEQLGQGEGLWERLGLESGLLQTRLLSGAAWPGQSPCQGSLWHQRRRVPLLPIPGDVLALRGAGTSLPSGLGVLWGAVPQRSLQVLPCRLPGILRGRGNLGRAWGRGSTCGTVPRELCFLWHQAEKAAAGNGIFLLGAFTDF